MQLYRAQILKALAYYYSLVGSHRLIIVEYFRNDLAVFFHERRECLRRYLGIAHAYHQIVLENGYQELRKHRPDDIVLPVLPLGERGDEHIGAACPAAEFTIEGYALRYGCIFSGFAVEPHAGGHAVRVQTEEVFLPEGDQPCNSLERFQPFAVQR